MNMLHYFVVKLDKRIQDEIDFNGGKIYLDTKFNEFEHRVCHGEVVATPKKYDTPVQVGDTLYFHHLVVINGGMPFEGREGEYLVSYDPAHVINCHAFAYTPSGCSEIIGLSHWSCLEPCEVPETKQSGIEEVSLSSPDPDSGKVHYVTERLAELGLSEGDVVVFQSNRRYDFKTASGDKMYRMRTSDLLYVQEEVHHD
jgi:hypothetical protein